MVLSHVVRVAVFTGFRLSTRRMIEKVLRLLTKCDAEIVFNKLLSSSLGPRAWSITSLRKACRRSVRTAAAQLRVVEQPHDLAKNAKTSEGH
jgi:hypothetical protein